MSRPVLAVEGASRAFGGVQAVRDVSFTLDAGRRLAIIGPNGAGKSTLFNLLNGQIPLDRGRIRIGSTDTAGLRPERVWRLGVGRTFQVAATFASMTVRENAGVALLSYRGSLGRLFGDAGRAVRREADDLLDRVGLAPLADAPCAALAYGDAKRLELAMALANRPSLLLMDEPTAGMAPAERGQLMRLVSNLALRDGVAVLFTEHDMAVVFGHADRILVLDRGAVIAEGAPDAIRADPRVRAVYLGEPA